MLLPHDLSDLRASGLTDEAIAACKLHSLDDYREIRATLHWRGGTKKLGSCLAIPYFDHLGRRIPGYVRLKPANPRLRKGKPAKYESPLGSTVHVYFPPHPDMPAVFDDPSRPLIITEGEKKSIKATWDGFPTVGIGGVESWSVTRTDIDPQTGRKTGRRELIDSLHKITWHGRKVFICYDSDAATKPSVRNAEHSLALALRREGACVHVIRLPSDGDRKLGLDDYLVLHGPTAFAALLQYSKPYFRCPDGAEPRQTIDDLGTGEPYVTPRAGVNGVPPNCVPPRRDPQCACPRMQSFIQERIDGKGGRVCMYPCDRLDCFACREIVQKRHRFNFTLRLGDESTPPTIYVFPCNDDIWRSSVSRRLREADADYIRDGVNSLVYSTMPPNSSSVHADTIREITPEQAIAELHAAVDSIPTDWSVKHPFSTSRRWAMPKEEKRATPFFRTVGKGPSGVSATQTAAQILQQHLIEPERKERKSIWSKYILTLNFRLGANHSAQKKAAVFRDLMRGEYMSEGGVDDLDFSAVDEWAAAWDETRAECNQGASCSWAPGELPGEMLFDMS